jgi:hypothetical protein
MTLAAALVLCVATAVAKSNTATVRIPETGVLNGTTVEAGTYKLTWEDHSPELTVTLLRKKEAVATVRGQMEERSTKYRRNQVLYDTDASGKSVISEIRLAGTNRAIVFTR